MGESLGEGGGAGGAVASPRVRHVDFEGLERSARGQGEQGEVVQVEEAGASEREVL